MDTLEFNVLCFHLIPLTTGQGDLEGHLSVDPVGLLSSTIEQRPTLVLHVTDMDVISIIFAKGDPCSSKHQEVVAM